MRRHWTFASAMLGMISAAFADPAPLEPSSFSANAQFSVDSGAVSSASAAVATIEARNLAPGYSWLRIYFYSGPLSKEDIAGAMNGKVNSRWNGVIQLTVDKDLKITQVDMSIPGHGCTIAPFEQEVRAFPQEYRFDGQNLILKSKGSYVCDMKFMGIPNQKFEWNIDLTVPVFEKVKSRK